MNRFARVFGALVVALGVSVPIALADDGGGSKGPTTASTVTCVRTVFAAGILRVGADSVTVRPGDSDASRPMVVRLDRETIVKKGDGIVDSAALVVGKRARFYVRVCRRDDRRIVTARVITLAGDPSAATPPPAPPRTEPSPTQDPKPEVCGQGELNTVLVSVSSSSITVQTTSSEGTKQWAIQITGDTVVRKNDVNVGISALRAGDLVHIVLVRCPSGSVRALRLVFLSSAPAQ